MAGPGLGPSPGPTRAGHLAEPAISHPEPFSARPRRHRRHAPRTRQKQDHAGTSSLERARERTTRHQEYRQGGQGDPSGTIDGYATDQQRSRSITTSATARRTVRPPVATFCRSQCERVLATQLEATTFRHESEHVRRSDPTSSAIPRTTPLGVPIGFASACPATRVCPIQPPIGSSRSALQRTAQRS